MAYEATEKMKGNDILETQAPKSLKSSLIKTQIQAC
jgi:hypothetical protein